MLKRHETEVADSCFNKAKEDELMFVLLERDPAAPAAIREWVNVRILVGKNRAHDPQILDALECARQMEQKRLPGSPTQSGPEQATGTP